MPHPGLAHLQPCSSTRSVRALVEAVTRWVSCLICLGLASSGAVGCYRPSIKDGGLMCAEATLACPDGYMCLGGRCRSPNQGDASVAPDMSGDRAVNPETGDGGDGGPAKEAGSEDADAAMCVDRQAMAGCTPKAGLVCDPVCQTGCCTTEKCTALSIGVGGTTTATLGCSKLEGQRHLGETCDPSNAFTSTRNDSCEAGLLCIVGNSDAICMKLCRDDEDCATGTKCQMRFIDGPSPSATKPTYSASVCGPPNTPCTPAGQATAGCPDGQTCYLITPDKNAGDRTVCDITSGDKGNGASCTYPFECLPGWTCPATGPGAGRCQPVCARAGTSAGSCPRTLNCQTTGRDFDLCL